MNKRFTLINRSHKREGTGRPENGSAMHNDTSASTDADLFELVRFALHRKNIIIGAVLGVMLITGVAVLLTPNKYSSRAIILPSGKMDRMAELKSLTGLDNMQLEDENSSQLFPVILKSRLVADSLIGKEYRFMHDGRPTRTTLPKYFDQDSPERLHSALDNVTTVRTDKKTGVINLTVETKYPGLSQALLSQYMTELENFNIHSRRSRAKENVRYIERELAEHERSLRRAEDSLETYQSLNRDWNLTSDPEVLKTIAQLKRDVEIKSQTFTFLTEQYEIAKLDAQKDVPIVRILDTPSLPTIKSGPHRLRTIILLGFAAFIVSLIAVILFDTMRKGIRERNSESFDLLRDDFNRAFPIVNRLAERTGTALASRS
ncbi:MAG: hypothetical protein JSU69_10600 [Candidatus Zixiibacteriota bacterium]|nr:MAG: hypothetical protein JSU69_10600 [candidate division Zixibacteria bacterium]